MRFFNSHIWEQNLTPRHNVYTGDGVLAEQIGSSTSGEVYWNHEDLLTGSYSKVTRSGSLLSGSPPRSAELEPLGGAIPQGDPNIYDDLTVPSGLRQFKFAGDVNRPDFGCEYNGGPVPCNLLSELIRGRDVMIGVRYQGDEGGAWGLRQSISTSIWRYNVRLVVDNEDKRLTAAMYRDKELLKDLPHGKVGLLIGTVYVAYITPFAELVIEHQASHQTRGKKPSDLAPKGLAADKKLSQEDCDKKLAKIFGGPKAVVGSTSDPLTLGFFDKAKELAKKASYGTKIVISGDRGLGHGPEPWPEGGGGDKGGIIHIYGDERGFDTGPLYTPAGGKVSGFSKDGLGNQIRRVTYDTGLTISFFHVSPSKENDANEGGSVRIGDLGGSGGDNAGYVHSHLIFYSDFARKIRVDPRKVFCGW